MEQTPTSFDELPLFMDVKYAAKVLGIGRNKVYELVKSGAIHAIKLGETIRIPKKSLEALLPAGE